MKFKTKDIVTLVIATVIMIGSIVAIYSMLNPTQQTTSQTSEADKIKKIPTSFDENTYKEIEALSDYGKPELDNIGKADLFGN